MSEIIQINEEEVRNLLTWDASFEAVKTSLECVSKRRVVQNPRGHTKWSESGSVLLTMPAYLQDPKFGALSCKLLTVCPNNVNLEKPRPIINANITLFDEETGVLKAIIGGVEITKWRTAAASAVATKYLTANKNIKVLAILGAGAQGCIHAVAFAHFFNFKEIRIWNRTKSKAENIVSELKTVYSNITFTCCDSNEECVQNADVIITTTFSDQPIVQLEWLKPGAHINAVGVNLSHHGELSDSIYANSDVYIDHAEGAATELIGLQKLGVKFQGEIGSIITGELPLPSGDRITVFQSLGMAVEDGAMARMIYDLHTRKLQSSSL